MNSDSAVVKTLAEQALLSVGIEISHYPHTYTILNLEGEPVGYGTTLTRADRRMSYGIRWSGDETPEQVKAELTKACRVLLRQDPLPDAIYAEPLVTL